MNTIALIGIDLCKHAFHVHCQEQSGKALLSKKFTRTKLMEFLTDCTPATVVMEACAGAHFMARQITDLGHEAKLISPQFVRPFVKSNKNDFIDAEAICEAASRPSMRFVQPKRKPNKPCVLCIVSGNHSSGIKSKRPIKCRLSYWSLVSACPRKWRL